MDHAATFQRLQQVFILIKSHEREFPAQLALIFFHICSHEGTHNKEIAKALGMTSSSVSRNIKWLGPRHRLGKEGLKLVYQTHVRTYNNKTSKTLHVFLTEKGKETARLIRKIMYPHT